MSITLEHPEAQIHIDKLSNGRRRILVQPFDKSMFIARKCCETSYPLELIQMILNVKGPAWLCDEICRDEDTSYVQLHLEKAILGYIMKEDFDNKKILDFGCGSGASTMILCRMFPNSQIVGMDIEGELLSIAKFRAQHYGFHNVKFFLSPSGMQLPTDIGYFDFVILSAVYEHLLPNEREFLLPQIWSTIKPSGVLFIDHTPNRYFPIEMHTTGLPFINYFPDQMALIIAQKFSRRIKNNYSWEILLRMGIRGATTREIIKILYDKCNNNPVLLEPSRLDLRDRVDLWYAISGSSRYPSLMLGLKFAFKLIHLFSGIVFIPTLSLAIQKEMCLNVETGCKKRQLRLKPLLGGED